MKKLFFLFIISSTTSFAQVNPSGVQNVPTGGCEGVDYLGIYSINTLDGNPVFALFNNIKYTATVILSPAMNTCDGNLTVSLMQSNKLIQLLAEQRATTGVHTTVNLPTLNVAPGRYDLVTAYDAYVYRSASTPISVIDITAVANVDNDYNVSIYPLPANNVVNIDISKATERIERVSLTDINGRVVKTIFPQTGSVTPVSVCDLPSGMYVLQLISSDAVQYKKLIVAH